MTVLDRHEDFLRTIVADQDTGETIARMIAFRGLGAVRIVIESELQRKGLTLDYDEAVAWRDALTAVLGEIDEWRAEILPDALTEAQDGG